MVAVSSAETTEGVDDIGWHLLDPKASLWQPPEERKEVTFDPKVLHGYVGQYRLAPNFTLTITPEGAQASGQAKAETFLESERDFSIRSWTPKSRLRPTALARPSA